MVQFREVLVISQKAEHKSQELVWFALQLFEGTCNCAQIEKENHLFYITLADSSNTSPFSQPCQNPTCTGIGPIVTDMRTKRLPRTETGWPSEGLTRPHNHKASSTQFFSTTCTKKGSNRKPLPSPGPFASASFGPANSPFPPKTEFLPPQAPRLQLTTAGTYQLPLESYKPVRLGGIPEVWWHHFRNQSLWFLPDCSEITWYWWVISWSGALFSWPTADPQCFFKRISWKPSLLGHLRELVDAVELSSNCLSQHHLGGGVLLSLTQV